MVNFLFSADGNRFDEELLSLEENRSFNFGDGFFETIRLYPDGRIPLAGYHLKRISESANLLEFSDFTDFRLEKLEHIVRAMNLPETNHARKLRLIFFRHGPGSYAPASDCRQLICASSRELDLSFISFIQSIAVSEKIRIYPSGFSRVKTTSALPYVLAGLERIKTGADEILLLSPEGFVVEGSYSSICWEDQEGIHFTPRALGGIDSCRRRFLEDYFRSALQPFTEKFISAEALLKESLWVCFASALGLRILRPEERSTRLPEIFYDSGLEFYQP